MSKQADHTGGCFLGNLGMYLSFLVNSLEQASMHICAHFWGVRSHLPELRDPFFAEH